VTGVSTDVWTQLRKGVVEFCVLGLLAERPRYGWELADTLITNNLIASIGTLYPMLTRLRSQGLVSTYDEVSGAGPVRKYYELTPAGIAQLASFRAHWGPFSSTVYRIVGGDEHHD